MDAQSSGASDPPVLDLRHLSIEAASRDGAVRVVDGVDLVVDRGEIVGLVGESGSGKSLTALAIGALLPNACRRAEGRVTLQGVGLDDRRAARRARGRDVAYVFQEPMTALNPAIRVGRQLGDVLRRHGAARDASTRAAEILASIGVDDPERVLRAWPHELSGGLRQRVLIALAFACRPKLIVADEPTTALDAAIKGQVLDLLRTSAQRSRTAVLLISHDIAAIQATCDRVYVMYAGQIVESGPVGAVLGSPAHPYTRALMAARPERGTPRRPLNVAQAGNPRLPASGGCRYLTRCAFGDEVCRTRPPLVPSLGGLAACWHLDRLAAPAR